jgi:hypothetical protein
MALSKFFKLVAFGVLQAKRLTGGERPRPTATIDAPPCAKSRAVKLVVAKYAKARGIQASAAA